MEKETTKKEPTTTKKEPTTAKKKEKTETKPIEVEGVKVGIMDQMFRVSDSGGRVYVKARTMKDAIKKYKAKKTK